MKVKTSVNVLLVDDERANLLAFSAILENLDVNLIYATSGEEALRQALLNDFAVILLDFYMPTMGGLEVAQIIRTRSQTPIIFITASGPEDFPIEAAYSLGAVDYFTKPYNSTVLKSKVAFFIELHKRTEALAASERARYLSELNVKDGRIRLILENARGYAFIVTDVEGKITEWEGDASMVTGWLPEEAIGQSITLIYTEKDRAARCSDIEFETAKATGVASDKRWHMRKDASRFYADGVTVPLKDAADQVHGFSKIFRDSTSEQLAAEELRLSLTKLEESRALFSLLLESSAEGIYGMGPDASCTFLNAAGAAMLGYRPEELVGKPIHSVIYNHHIDESDYPIEECRISKAAREGQAIRVDDEVFWHKDGRAIPVSYSVAPMISGGAPTGAVINFADVTERKKTEESLRRLADDLAEADRRKSEFLATLAHELRNPLAPIRNGLAILRIGGDSAASLAKTREMMERQVNHMVRLVDDLLDISRISGGKIDLKKEPIALKELITSAIETSLPFIVSGQHKLVIDIIDDAITLYVDPIRITQVIANLLNNAAKYTPTGGQIEVGVAIEGNEAVLSVKDNGMGIPAEALSTIFEMFNQVPRNMGLAQGGLGIGLTLVRQIVEMHGGTVTALSTDGAGSLFVVKLPISDVNYSLPEVAQVIVDSNSESNNKKLQPLRIMVVDDNVDAAESLSALLQLGGHTLYVANDGYEAVKMAVICKPHIIFLDIGMPGMDGYETASAIRKIDDLQGMILVALTGWGAEEDRARSREAGFDKHLTKPVKLDTLRTLLSTLNPLSNK